MGRTRQTQMGPLTYSQTWARNNPEKIKIALEKHYAKMTPEQKEKKRQNNRRFYANMSTERLKEKHARADKQKIKDNVDRVVYNLLPGERQKIWEFQKGLDPITGQPLVPRANLDHCHKTGRVRGLLNPMTNRFLVDDISKLKAMLAYLQNPTAPIALGEEVYGMIGQARRGKRKTFYGPEKSKTPHPRKATKEGGTICPE